MIPLLGKGSHKCGVSFRVKRNFKNLSINRVRGCFGFSIWLLSTCESLAGFYKGSRENEDGVGLPKREVLHIRSCVRITEICVVDGKSIYSSQIFHSVKLYTV